MIQVTIGYRTGDPVVKVVSDERALELENEASMDPRVVGVLRVPVKARS